jgi:prefoldin subunit 5
MNKITTNTLIPLSLAFAIGIGVFWISKSQATIDNNERRIVELENSNKGTNEKLDRISQRLARIEGLLEKLGKKN